MGGRSISFGNENLSTTGTLAAGTSLVGGTMTMAGGSLTDSSGAINFGNENLSTTGTLAAGTSLVGGTMTMAGGSLTDSSGAINFGNENLSTTGTLASGALTVTGAVLSNADDGGALGTSGTGWSDLFLASGAVINFNAGDVTLTHSAGLLTISDEIVVSGTGPHAFGSATQDYTRLLVNGAFTSGGASSITMGLDNSGALTGAVGDTTCLLGARFNCSIVTQGTDTNIFYVAQVAIHEPQITNNLASAGAPDVAASLYIVSAPTEGDVNAALYVASGALIASGGGSLTGTWSDLGSVTTVDINGGTIDGATVGASSATTGAFTTLTASSTSYFAGNVGIGVAAGSSAAFTVREEVSGARVVILQQTHASAPHGVIIQYTVASPNGTGNNFLYMADASAARMAVRSNGGIANFQSNDADLSDARLKEVYGALDSTWDAHKAMDIVEFRYLDNLESRIMIGVTAQQVQRVAPRLFSERGWGDDKHHAVYEKDRGYFTARTVQECQLRIEALEEEVRELKAA